MALTETKPINIGFKAPDFSLIDSKDNQSKSLENLKGRNGTIIAFICNHCPYVIHVIDEIISLTKDYQEKGINLIAINSNDVEKYPEDSPELMKKWAEDKNFPFPYLFDETQEVAMAYHAACTPDFSLFDADLKCVYRGRLDASTPGNKVGLTGADLRKAIDNLLAEKAPLEEQFPSMGCNIKWK